MKNYSWMALVGASTAASVAVGAGLGARHQTGWKGLMAKLIQLFGLLDAKKLLEGGQGCRLWPGTVGR